MDYITSQEAAVKWCLTRRCVQNYCKNGKIQGAINLGKQWLIPANTEKPQDARFVKNRLPSDIEVYHFPLIVYTRYFVSRSELSEDERSLLEAQLLTARGNISESIGLCRRLEAEAASDSVRFGAFATACYDYLVIGLYSGIVKCLDAMELIRSKSPQHDEDYKLIIAALKFQFTVDISGLMAIDVNRLSADALIAYECFIMQTMVFEQATCSDKALKLRLAFIKRLESFGILPVLAVAHSMYAMLIVRTDDRSARLEHIAETCRICHDNDYPVILSKYSVLSLDEYRAYLLENYGSGYADKIFRRRESDGQAWRIVYGAANGENLGQLTDDENEFFFLLSINTSNKQIALLKKLTAKETTDMIKTLCEKYGLSTKKELVEYSKKIIRSYQNT